MFAYLAPLIDNSIVYGLNAAATFGIGIFVIAVAQSIFLLPQTFYGTRQQSLKNLFTWIGIWLFTLGMIKFTQTALLLDAATTFSFLYPLLTVLRISEFCISFIVFILCIHEYKIRLLNDSEVKNVDELVNVTLVSR